MGLSVSYRNHLPAQAGTVLVMVLFYLSIIIAIATRFTGDFQLSVLRAQQGLTSTQLQQYILSMESFAAWVLLEDAEADKNNNRYTQNGSHGNYDHLAEDWMSGIQAPIDEANIQASLQDALSRFNLNQLQGRPSPYKPNGSFSERFTPAQKRFIRLLQTQPDDQIDVSLAQEITQAVMDWIDADDNISGQGGAESNYYGSLEPAYKAANQPFVSVTELRQVKGITPEIYQYIAPFLIALPTNEGININTASATLLRSLNQTNTQTPLTQADAETLMSTRPVATSNTDENNIDENTNREAFESVDAFFDSDSAQQIFGTDVKLWPAKDGLKTGSEYFILDTQVELADYQQRQLSVLKRQTISTGVKVMVMRRSREQL